MKNKKVVTLTLIGLLIFLFGIIGITYAYWNRILTQRDENLVYSDCLKLTVDWGENGFQLTNAYPMTNDELISDFFPNQTPYHFTIKNTCDNDIPVSINMESLNVDGISLKDEYVDVILWNSDTTEKMTQGTTEVLSHEDKDGESRYQLTKNKENQNKIIPDANKAYQLYKFKLEGKQSKSFNLLLFMDYDTPVDGTLDEDGQQIHTNNANWAGKITLNNYQPMNKMIAMDIYQDEDSWSFSLNNNSYTTVGEQHYNNISKVIFESKIDPPEIYADKKDFSEDQTGSIMGYYIKDDGLDVESYTLRIQSNEKIIVNENASYFFTTYCNESGSGASSRCAFNTVFEGLENLDTSQVQDMSSMFWHNSSFTNLDLSTFDTTNVTNMEGMFSGMDQLQTLTLGNQFNTSHVQDMNSMFSEMSQLQTLDLSQGNFDTSHVKDMKWMFSNMTSLNTLTLGEQFNTSQVQDMSSMFYNMKNLTQLQLGNSFDTRNVTDMSSMFNGLSRITTLTLGEQFDTSHVQDMYNMFSGMSSLQSLDLSQSHFDTSEVTDMSHMFSGMTSLDTLTLGNQFNTSHVQDMSSMFSGISQLQSLDLSQSHFDTSEVTDMSYMFSGMTSLEHLTLGSLFNTSRVMNMGSMFSEMSQLQLLDLSTFDTSKVTYMVEMFYNDVLLSQINYGLNFKKNESCSTGNMFENTSPELKMPTDASWFMEDWYEEA